MGLSESFLMILLSSLLFLLPSLLCGPKYSSGNLDHNIDQGMIDDIFGSSLDSARYGNDEEEWTEVPISLLPGDGEDDCGAIQEPRQVPTMMEMNEELSKIEVVKADGSKKCDFYTETEGFECVPYYQCDEGTIITDGYGLIDIRFGGDDTGQPQLAILDSSDLMCPGSLDVCCKDPDFLKENEKLTDGSYGQPDEYEVNYEEEGGYGGEDNGDGNDGDGRDDGYGKTEDLVEDPYGKTDDDSSSSSSEEDAGNDGYGKTDGETENLQESATALPVDPNPYNPLPEKLVFQPQCGRRNHQGLGVRIQNYQDGEAQFGEWPHMCAVLEREIVEREEEVETGGYGGVEIQVVKEEVLKFVGGASLIAPGVILTGAHKVKNFVEDSSKLIVRCGEWDTQIESEPLIHQDRNVTATVLHPEFNPKTVVNTIALLFLETEFNLDSHIDTICLPAYQQNFDDRKQCFVKGWGKDIFGPDGSYQVVMKEVDVPMVPHGDCQTMLRNTPRLPRQFKLDKSFVCAGGEEGKDACRGDGGGPLVCAGDTDGFTDPVYTQVGIVAWGIGCGQEDVPGVYTDVAAQVCWIDWVMACQEGYDHVLLNGEECNDWLWKKQNHKFKPIRNLYKNCNVNWGQSEDLTEVGYGRK